MKQTNDSKIRYKCLKCGKTFKIPHTVTAAEYPGGKAWPEDYCPKCGANSGNIDEI